MLKAIFALLAGSVVLILVFAAIYIVAAAILGRIFKLAGQPSLAAFIPIYNLYIFCKITFGSGIYFLIPLVAGFLPEKIGGIVSGLFFLVSMYLLGKVFNKGLLYTLGLMIPFTSPVFIILLALSDSQYSGKASSF